MGFLYQYHSILFSSSQLLYFYISCNWKVFAIGRDLRQYYSGRSEWRYNLVVCCAVLRLEGRNENGKKEGGFRTRFNTISLVLCHLPFFSLPHQSFAMSCSKQVCYHEAYASILNQNISLSAEKIICLKNLGYTHYATQLFHLD